MGKIAPKMTDKLPPQLLALFTARPNLRYLPPNDHAPEERKTARVTGVAAYAHLLKEEFGDYQPTESWLEAKDRTKLEKEDHQKWLVTKGVEEHYKPAEDKNIRGDAFKTLFVSRLSYDTEVKDLEREFGRYGPIERVRIVIGSGENDKKHKGKPRGYAFVVFERERDMKGDYSVTYFLRTQEVSSHRSFC